MIKTSQAAPPTATKNVIWFLLKECVISVFLYSKTNQNNKIIQTIKSTINTVAR
jgi:hypothetical protein